MSYRPFLIYSGLFDDFIPKHLAVIQEIFIKGYLPNKYFTEQMPGFYVFGEIIISITGLSIEALYYLPVQLIPTVLIFFSFAYRLSSNYIASALIVFIFMISDVKGTPSVFFWPHGLGTILFFMLILLLYNMLYNSKNLNRYKLGSSEIFIISVLASSSLVFLSYNLAAMFIILLIIVIAIINLLNFAKRSHKNLRSFMRVRRTLITLCMIVIIVQFDLSEFFYKTWIPLMEHLDVITLGGFDKLILTYFNTRINDHPIGNYVFTFPVELSIIAGIKYIILFSSISIFLVLLLKRITHTKDISVTDLIVTSIIIMTIFYSFLRLQIGDMVITLFFIPGIMCILSFFSSKGNIKIWATIALILLLILTPTCYYIYSGKNLLNRHLEDKISLHASSDWLIGKRSSNCLIQSDELTKNLFFLNDVLANGDFEESALKYRSLTENVVLSLVGDRGGYNTLINSYYIMNYHPTRVNIGNWITLNSWVSLRETINRNVYINKVYNNYYLDISISRK